MRIGLTLAVLLAATAAAPRAVSQEGPLGVGFAQAEEGTWWCHGATVGGALDCARQRCIAEAGGQTCHATRWCFPAGWSALMVVWLPEFHATQVLCGMPGREVAVAAMKAICEAGAEFSQCDLVLHLDPEGNRIDAEGVSWPGGAALDTPPSAAE